MALASSSGKSPSIVTWMPGSSYEKLISTPPTSIRWSPQPSAGLLGMEDGGKGNGVLAHGQVEPFAIGASDEVFHAGFVGGSVKRNPPFLQALRRLIRMACRAREKGTSLIKPCRVRCADLSFSPITVRTADPTPI